MADIGVDGQGKYTCIATNAEGSMEKMVDVEVFHIVLLLSYNQDFPPTIISLVKI